MKKWLLLIIVLSSLTVNCYAGEVYAVIHIPPALLKNSNVIKRMEEIRFEVLDIGRTKLYHKYALTILNEMGDKHAGWMENYDKLHSIVSIEGKLFDAMGNKIRTLKKSDVKDYSGTDNISLADDNRIKHFSFYHKSYPYTVEYEVEIKFNYTLFYPGWIPQEDEYYAVEQSRLTIVCPMDMDFRYKAFNYPGKPVEGTEKNSKLLSWEIKNVPAVIAEYASPSWNEIITAVCLGPVQFQVGNYTGNMSSWQDFGKFVYALKNGRDNLPDNIRKAVHELSDGLPDEKKKVEVLYDFLQKNTRYISVQLGIGGWQPFDASYVAANRYGDCKALSNYMYSLLKEAGIKSYYTLVKAGNNRHYFINDFPSSQFNHAILCVPLQKDTMWLECTSQTNAPGYLGSFTSDRSVLIVDEQGGKLVRTPSYGLAENIQLRKIIASIDENGNLKADINTAYKALQQDRLHSLIKSLSKEKLLEYLKKELDLPNYDVVKFDYTEERSIIPVINESLTVVNENYAQLSGSRLFITPNIISRSHKKLMTDSIRKFDVVLDNVYKDVDTVEIKIPANYQLESVAKPVDLKTRFGHYKSSTHLSGDKIIYYRSMEEFKGRFPPSAFNDLAKFFNEIYKADRNKIVLVKNN